MKEPMKLPMLYFVTGGTLLPGRCCILADTPVGLTEATAREVIRRAEAYEGLCAERDALRESLQEYVDAEGYNPRGTIPHIRLVKAQAALAKSEKKI